MRLFKSSCSLKGPAGPQFRQILTVVAVGLLGLLPASSTAQSTADIAAFVGRNGTVRLQPSGATVLGEGLVTLDDVRSAVVLADKSIVVASKAVAAVIKYDRSGRQLQTFGRWGEGPFEYVAPSIVRTYGNGVVVFDSGTLKFVRYRADGSGVEEWKGMTHSLSDFYMDSDDIVGFTGSAFDYFLLRIDRAAQDTSRFAEGSMLRSAVMSYEGTGNFGVRSGRAYYSYPDESAVRIVDTVTGSETVVRIPDPEWKVVSGILPADDFDDLNHALFDGRLLKYLSGSSMNLGVKVLDDYTVAMIEDGHMSLDGSPVPEGKERVLKLFVFDRQMKLLDVVILNGADRDKVGSVPVGTDGNALLFVNAEERGGGTDIEWKFRKLEIKGG